MSAHHSLAMPRGGHWTRAISAAFLTLGIASCSGPDSPHGAASALDSRATVAEAAGFGAGMFYPLDVGNAWDYEGGGSLRHITNGSPSEPFLTYAFTETHRLIGTTTQGGTGYVVEEQVHHEVPEREDGPFTYWSRFRQDAAGLFVLDTLLSSPPPVESTGVDGVPAGSMLRPPIDLSRLESSLATNPALQRLTHRFEILRRTVRAAGRVDPSASNGLELTELLYPLRVGQSWSIRPDFPWPARVDRVESIDTPAGRITAYRIELNPFGTTVHEGEWVRVWWSRQGYLGYSIHSVEEEIGEHVPPGTLFVADEAMTVNRIDLVR